MDKKAQLKEINTELKVYINESTFISNKCRNKLLHFLGEAYDVELPIDDFARIDVSLMEDGSIEMRGEVYKRDDALRFDEVLSRYQVFKEKADLLIEKKGKYSFPSHDRNNIGNLVIVGIFSFFFFVLFIYGIRALLTGDFASSLWLFLIVFFFLFPRVRDRFSQAFHYMRQKFKK